MENYNFTLIGSSNAIGLQHTNPKHPIFQGNGITFINKSKRGMNAKGVQSKKSFLHYNFKNRSKQYYIICLGPNGFRFRKYDGFLKTYLKNIKTLLQCIPAENLVIILPLPRGHFGLHKQQMKKVKEFGYDIVRLGIHIIHPYQHLPRRLKHTKSLFGKKDLKKKKYVHFSSKIRSKIYYLIGDKVREIVANIKEPDTVTRQIGSLAITSVSREDVAAPLPYPNPPSLHHYPHNL